MDAAATNSPGVQQPHPLKGIVNSNDDPMLCAVCSVTAEDYGNFRSYLCCGRGICESCCDDRCLVCKLPANVLSSTKSSKDCLKKHVKKGRAWAQIELAMRHLTSNGVKSSSSEAFHWCREAAKRGHPMGMYILGKGFLDGTLGCSVDFLQAQEYFEASLRANRGYSKAGQKHCWKGLTEIAQHHARAKSFERARSIVQPIAEEGIGEAQALMGTVLSDAHHDHHSALAWFTSATFAPYIGGDGGKKMMNAEHGAMMCCLELEKHAQAKFWGKLSRMAPATRGVVASTYAYRTCKASRRSSA